MNPRQVTGFSYAPLVRPTNQGAYDVFQRDFQIKRMLEEQKIQEAERKRAQGKRGSGDQSFLSSIISELGGAGGATGGAALGATLGSVVPGLGTLAGGIIGGAAGGLIGGTGGRLIENQVRDNEMRLGDALKEGAWSGVFGGAGSAFQAGRGAYAAGKAAGIGGQGLTNTIKGGASLIDDSVRAAGSGASLLDDALKGSGKAGRAVIRSGAKSGKTIGQLSTKGGANLDDILSGSRKGMLSAGDKSRSFQRGISPGANNVSPEQAKRYNKALDGVNKWFGGKTKGAQFTNTDDAMKALSNQYARSPEATKAFQGAGKISTTFDDIVKRNPSLKEFMKDGSNRKLASGLKSELKKVKTNDDFLKFVSEQINPRYRAMVSQTGSMGSKETQIYEAFRQATKNFIDEGLPGRSGLNKQFSNLMGASTELGKTITRDLNAGAGQGFTPGRIVSDIVNPALDVAGRGMQQAGKVTQYTTPVVGGATLRGVLNGGEPVEQAPDTEVISSFEGPSYDNVLGGDSTTLTGEVMQQPDNPYAPQNLQAGVQEILAQGGDFDDVKKYLSIAETLQDLTGSASGQPELTANQKNKMIQLQSVGQELNTLRNEVVQSGLFGEGSQLSASLGGFYDSTIGRLTDQQKKIYQDQLKTRGIQLVRALGEVGNLSEAEQEAAIKNLPSPGDTLDGAMQKLQQLEDRFNNLTMIVQQGGGGTGFGGDSDLASILQQAGYQ